MAFYKYTCKNCDHIYYDITVTCNPNTKEPCPICNEEHELELEYVEPKEGQETAEEKGCKHDKVGEHKNCDSCPNKEKCGK